MKTILILAAYSVYAIFLGRLLWHALIWCRAVREPGIAQDDAGGAVCLLTAMDLIFFRRLFVVDKLVWVGSWTFHVSFFLVVLRHLKYFMDPVPYWIACIQPAGLVAGYVLPVSLAYTILLRLTVRREKYISYYNFFILGLVLIISIAGLLMNAVYMVDVVDVKYFIMGIFAFKPAAAPESFLFIMHFLLVLLLLLYLPFHIFTAPFVTMAARRREEELGLVMHGK